MKTNTKSHQNEPQSLGTLPNPPPLRFKVVSDEEYSDWIQDGLPQEEADEVEERLTEHPALHVRALAERAEARRIARAKVVEVEFTTNLFQVPAKKQGKMFVRGDDKIPGPLDILNTQGKRHEVQVTVRETNEGDICIYAESDLELAGKTLQFGGPDGLPLLLADERGKAFARVTCSIAKYLRLCEQFSGKVTYVWK